MGYTERNLSPNEKVVYKTRLHWKIFILPLLTLLFGIYLYSSEKWFVSILAYPILVSSIIWLLIEIIDYLFSEFAVTNYLIILKAGVLRPKSKQIFLNQIGAVDIYDPILGSLLGYGNISVASNDDKQIFRAIASHQEFWKKAKEQARNPQIESSTVESSNKYLDGDIQPIKVTPSTSSELERIQSEFKFYSHAQKSYKTVPLPKVGEEWKLERTLPSGLVLILDNEEESFKKLIKDFIPEVILGRDIYADFDERPYLYDVERFKREDSRRGTVLFETNSIAWHPTGMLLATAGQANLSRIWNVTTGQLTANKHRVDSKTGGENLCWSSNGELFLSGYDIFDGITGNYLCHFNGTLDRYSNNKYGELRGYYYTNSGLNSHLTSTNNFSPWRPNSNQLVFGDSGKNLILRNGRTGEIEKAINCDVSSYISDFAWHPKGRFIAIAFKEDNIRIIDIDDVKIVANLSVQNLVGWSPDGKILVVRKDKDKDDFVVWDALETEEKSMPEERKNELWFKRFFKNISADGLRYIKVEDGKGNIYSLETDELVATLPKAITSAAWSPIDGGLLATCGGSETHIWRI